MQRWGTEPVAIDFWSVNTIDRLYAHDVDSLYIQVS